MAASYSFRSSWPVPAEPARVWAVLEDLAGYADWWPQVRAVVRLSEDRARVRVRSVLPYTLDLVLTAVVREPRCLEARVDGDLVGFVRWRLSADGLGTQLELEQEVEVTGRLGRLSPVLRPLLVWNHERMMAGCRENLIAAVRARG